MMKHLCKVSLTVVAMAMAMALTGCMAQEVEIDFNGDGSGNLTFGYYVSKEAIAMLDALDSIDSDGAYTSDTDGDALSSIRDSFEEAVADANAVGATAEVVEKSYDGVEYEGVVAKVGFGTLDELNEALNAFGESAGGTDSGSGNSVAAFTVESAMAESGVTSVTVHCKFVDETSTEQEVALDGSVELSGDVEEQLKNASRMSMTLKFNGGVTEVNGIESGGYTVSDDNNSVSIDLVTAGSEEFSVTGKLIDNGSQFAEPSTPIDDKFVETRTYRDQFTDVPEGIWYREHMVKLYELGIVNGSSNTEFNPDGKLTLAEVITMAARVHATANGVELDNSTGKTWYAPYVVYALESGILKDVNDLGADFGRAVRRDEMAYVLANCMYDVPPEFVSGSTGFSDTEGSRFEDSIAKLHNLGVAVGTGDGKFNPAADLTRAEAVTFVSRLVTALDMGSM